jgi:hypothetical protein
MSAVAKEKSLPVFKVHDRGFHEFARVFRIPYILRATGVVVHVRMQPRNEGSIRECYAPPLRVLSYPEIRKKARNRPKKENDRET